MSTANKQLLGFRQFLARSWTTVEKQLAEAPEVLADWQQANWEVLVESAVLGPGQFLEVYGEGADCNGSSSRVWTPAALPTHAIHVSPRMGQDFFERITGQYFSCPTRGLQMDRFVTFTSAGWYETRPPFDYVLAIAGDGEKVVSVVEIEFFVVEIE